ncbi:MAG: nitrate reductase molybdenum cofactor assembly chaperone, partial [Candidatus Odyssella sp.]|nr:nitrate reductase molybdenum cofactor assembly chaperone [Candidatus Odyssella sp.]
LPAKHRAAVGALIDAIGRGALLDAQEKYVALFDLGRGCSLHLFEHVYGDSRERGQAMVALADRYRAAGLAVSANELPDYLPLVLEYISVAPPAEAKGLLAEIAHVVEALGERLAKRESPYAAVMAALGALAGKRLHSTADLVTIDDDDSPEALDRAWEEAAVTFGPENAPQNGGCDRAAAIVSRMNQGS